MMNIFIVILAILFMAGYYVMDAPSQRMREHETQFAVNQSDLRSVAQCAAAVHNAKMKGLEFDDICVEMNYIISENICMDSRMNNTACEIVNKKKPAYSYIITATGILPEEDYNNMLEILEKHYPDAGTFGIFQNGKIISGGTSNKRTVPAKIMSKMGLQDGQIVYLTQYDIPDNQYEYETPMDDDIVCPTGTVKAYRFGRWQCSGYNTKTNCAGDKIWNSDLQECVPDESRKPLCGGNMTAVMVDDIWECVSPFIEKNCPANMVARLNYNTLEWECVSDPKYTQDTKKCDVITQAAVYGAMGATLRVPRSSCTDCETMLVDNETCTATCVPDPTKLNNERCYPGSVRTCSGSTRAFYFGFPSQEYISGVDAVKNIIVPLDKRYSQNRKFNCMDCGERGIDMGRSLPPYVVVCNE
ncbi:MAG: hypothetical protein IKA73_01610 [Alphaproteobacteria bacterium]|nr:hypothetical protein [Alphaproteobacteria bacterium]